MALPDITVWPCEAIWQAVVPQLPGFSVEVVPEIDSTNAELMRRARAGQAEPVLLVAEHQTAGRGRLGRYWHSEEGRGAGGPACLTFSLGLSLAPQDWSGLSLAVGLSLAQSLHPDIRLKWPNDLWWRDRKLAGILIETVHVANVYADRRRYVVIGMGVNIQTPTPPGLSTEAVGLTELTSGMDAMQALAGSVPPLVDAILRFEQRGFAPFQAAFHARDALVQRVVTLSDGSQGLALGVDAQGALQVQTPLGLRSVTSAEVSVRPVPGPDDHHS
ncbi:biotin--[acetyl-CoA-carboxylase] ligase [Rhodoferax sp.]|uniref:biotin--[acetyl-CoA-carboxylase] ligase n=1 Tax=Rhodoferax sp. TaxID=50421 RepID=UPI00262E47B6|nr:biotin--[acetyl-CoA-carboxylase] ligase [Rhodoferax sp.]MDD2927095.1 biotin--[acetyl-CoA-carboxylase] ligase [Rhodoferax sp.]